MMDPREKWTTERAPVQAKKCLVRLPQPNPKSAVTKLSQNTKRKCETHSQGADAYSSKRVKGSEVEDEDEIVESEEGEQQLSEINGKLGLLERQISERATARSERARNQREGGRNDRDRHENTDSCV